MLRLLFLYFVSGLTNTVTAVKNAQMAESPLLLMGGAAATLLKVNLFIIAMFYLM
jgi:thiamine pyrophosphate-dependent acetolactate synthase large subunit-like protein